jgi:hypothetical protein
VDGPAADGDHADQVVVVAGGICLLAHVVIRSVSLSSMIPRRAASVAVTALLAVALLSAPAFGQTAPTVTGRVIDAFSMGPLAGARVAAGSLTATTDRDGRFSLTLPPGPARLIVTADGHLPEQVDVTAGGQTVTLEVLLLSRSQFTEDVVVTAGAKPAPTAPATIDVSPLAVRSIAGAAENVFRTVQTLPGVNATEDFGSRLSVRGGGPDQNLTAMDGVEIHDPYRLFGLTSAFNPETVENFEFVAGGFSPKYGDRLSSILLIENRPGTQTRAFAGSFSLALTDANAVVEGKLPGDMKGSWIVSARRTYYDLIANRIVGTTLPSFGDVQAKASWEMRPGQRLSIFVLRSREKTDAQFDSSSTDSSLGLGNRAFNDLLSVSLASTFGTRVSARTTASWYRYGDSLDAAGNVRDEASRSNAPGDAAFGRSNVAFTRDLGVRDLSAREELAISASPKHLIETGGDVHALDTSWGWTISGDRNTNEANGSSIRGGTGLPSLLDSRQQSVRAAAWAVDRFQVMPRLRIDPGLRLDWNGVAGEFILSPRVSARVNAGRGFAVRGSVGLFTQSPGYEKLLQSDYFVDLTAARELSLKSERSVHVLGSVEREFAPGAVARVEGYYKSFDRLIVGRLETPAETAARVALYDFPADLRSSIPLAPQITSNPENGATGQAYGFDVYVAHQPRSASERFAGWGSYTWGHATIDGYGRGYPFDYDRRHALSLVGTYRAKRWLELAGSARVASGFPYAPVLGLVVAASEVTDASGNLVKYVPKVDANGLYVWTTTRGGVDNLNAARLPLFARVDVRATFRPSWSANRWQLYVEVINVLNRENAGSLDPVLSYDPSSDRPSISYQRNGGFPLLPSIGIRCRF